MQLISFFLNSITGTWPCLVTNDQSNKCGDSRGQTRFKSTLIFGRNIAKKW